ncbi:hypothetical protein J6590_065919 [Homalodisca vitripennis]|nr:hypothetical protein J6590_065919 [Homalodisca vitripennis]
MRQDFIRKGYGLGPPWLVGGLVGSPQGSPTLRAQMYSPYVKKKISVDTDYFSVYPCDKLMRIYNSSIFSILWPTRLKKLLSDRQYLVTAVNNPAKQTEEFKLVMSC